MILLKNVHVVLEDRVLENHHILLDGKIRSITATLPESAEPVQAIDGGGLFASPGLIDLHIHGASGADTMDGTAETLPTIASALPACGVTAFLPTTMTMDWDTIETALSRIREAITHPPVGARILGAHLEGPFISTARRGAQNPEFIRTPDIEKIRPWADCIRIVTLAPEAPGAEIFLKELARYPHIVASIGHSDATYEEALASLRWGIRHVTHCFNGMSPFHHRNPGVVGFALGHPVTAEIICDDIHVNPHFYDAFLNIKGAGNVVLITDSMRAGCLKDGLYDLGGQTVHVENGAARLADGTLAGSVLTLNQALENVRAKTGRTLPELVALASLNPARVLGLDHCKGRLAEGYDADLFLHDARFTVHMTFIEGEPVYQKAVDP